MDTTFISFSSAAVTDFSGNPIVMISRLNAKAVDDFTPDISPPTLQGFDLLIGADQLVLTFSETVNGATLDPTLFTLHSTQNQSSAISYTLSGSRGITDINSSVVVIDFLIPDLNAIKRDADFATASENTFLTHNTSAVFDTSEMQ